MQQPCTLLIIGSAGNGKSTLGNRLRNVEATSSDAFRESDSTDSETMNTVVKQGNYEGVPITVIDTPGLNDSHGMDALHLSEMISTIRRHNTVHGIAIVLNGQADRFDDNLKRMIRLLWNLFGSNLEIWSHVCLVFTKCYAAVPMNTENKRTKYSNILLQILQECNQGANFLSTFQCYFIDSKDRNNQSSNSDFSFLLAWLSSLQVIDSNRLVVPNVNYFKVETETFTEVVSQETTQIYGTQDVWRNKILGTKKQVTVVTGSVTTYTKQTKTREVLILYDGKTKTYGDWKIVRTWTE